VTTQVSDTGSLRRIENLMRRHRPGWWAELCGIIPGLKRLEGLAQPVEYHAEGDVATHTRRAVEGCPEDGDPDLLWIALLHDIGKADTTTRRQDGRITAHGHAKQGALLAEEILTGLEMPPERRDRIVWVIRYHMFHHSWQIGTPEELTRRQRAYLLDDRFTLLLDFMRIDALASEGNPRGLDDYEFYQKLWASLQGKRT